MRFALWRFRLRLAQLGDHLLHLCAQRFHLEGARAQIGRHRKPGLGSARMQLRKLGLGEAHGYAGTLAAPVDIRRDRAGRDPTSRSWTLWGPMRTRHRRLQWRLVRFACTAMSRMRSQGALVTERGYVVLELVPFGGLAAGLRFRSR